MSFATRIAVKSVFPVSSQGHNSLPGRVSIISSADPNLEAFTAIVVVRLFRVKSFPGQRIRCHPQFQHEFLYVVPDWTDPPAIRGHQNDDTDKYLLAGRHRHHPAEFGRHRLEAPFVTPHPNSRRSAQPSLATDGRACRPDEPKSKIAVPRRARSSWQWRSTSRTSPPPPDTLGSTLLFRWEIG